MEGIKLKQDFLKVINFQSWTKFTGVSFFVFETFSYTETLALPMPLNLTQKRLFWWKMEDNSSKTMYLQNKVNILYRFSKIKILIKFGNSKIYWVFNK